MKKHFIVALATILTLFATESVRGEGKYKPEVIEHLIRKVEDTWSKGLKPTVILDLDDTLLDTRARTYKIFRDFVLQEDIGHEFPREKKLVFKMRISDVSYYAKDALYNIGIRNEDFVSRSLEFWEQAFFSNDYCEFDRTISGAAPYVRRLESAGALIVYLTGRSETDMKECTEESLKRNRFPTGNRSLLIMKAKKEMSDLEFKKSKFADIAAFGLVVGGFENEAINVNALKVAFPKSQMIYVDTVHSNKPDVPAADIPWIRDFRMVVSPWSLENLRLHH